jgi:hypothetical protein
MNTALEEETMTKTRSFSKAENELLPKFRKLTNEAESTEDVKKFFVYCIQELFDHALDGRLNLQFGDVGLQPEGKRPFFISDQVQANADFSEVWQNSDLPHIVSRLAEQALGHYRHLEKNPAKTEAKIRK